jgi:hypothetical protein
MTTRTIAILMSAAAPFLLDLADAHPIDPAIRSARQKARCEGYLSAGAPGKPEDRKRCRLT